MAPLFDASARRCDWRATRGDVATLPLHVMSGGADVDVSGLTFAAQARRSADASDAVTLTVDTTNAATGHVLVTMAAIDTAAGGAWVWDLESSAGAGSRTWIGGSLIFEPDVTR